MNPLKHIKTIFFDYDGTLHDSIHIYAPAFRKAYDYLVRNGLAGKRDWSDQEISYWLGYSPPDMWKAFMPELDESLRQKCSDMIAVEMKNQILCRNPRLYKEVPDVLEYLKNKGYCLVFLSNCRIYYMECHKQLFHLDRYFDALVCSEEYDFIPKHEILKIIKSNYPRNQVMVGDRVHDMEAGKRNNIKTIGCSYGYALPRELAQADIIIDDIKELRNYL